MNTYKYEVTYKNNGEQDYCSVRAINKENAIEQVLKKYGNVAIVSVSRIGN